MAPQNIVTIEQLVEIKTFMIERKFTLAVAESITSGNVQSIFAQVPGASNFFNGGITAYNIDQKVSHLDVDREHASSVNCVSDIVALQMAIGVAARFNADFGISTTGFADGSDQLAYFAIIQKSRSTHQNTVLKQDVVLGSRLTRIQMQTYVANRVVSSFYSLIETKS